MIYSEVKVNITARGAPEGSKTVEFGYNAFDLREYNLHHSLMLSDLLGLRASSDEATL